MKEHIVGLTMEKDNYLTLEGPARAEQKIKNSRFIANALPIQSRAEAEKQISQLSDQYHDAAHNCFAYRVGVTQDVIAQFNDAGEPSGTAGRPILQALEERELTNGLIVVTRYFGGTKLGTGGLIRAYGSSARLAIERAGVRIRYVQVQLRVSFPYRLTNVVIHQLQVAGAQIAQRDYDESSHFLVQIRRSLASMLVNDLTDISAGEAKIHILEQEF